MAIRYADVIVDLQYGDTGKGKVAHHLAKTREYDLVLRYNGGSNAGHTVYHAGNKIVTHQIPVGVLYGIPSIIGLGCVVNINKLRQEIIQLNDVGFHTKGLIKVDRRAHVVTDDHLGEDGRDEKIGTTRQGIGPAYRDKYGRIGKRIGDVCDETEEFELIDTYEFLFTSSQKYKILCEGAQGFHLDIDWGDYPYVTSSHCTVGSVALNGIPPHKIRRVYGIMKAYETYVGNKTTFTDEDDETFKKIQIVGQEFGATTGRPRKVNWMNIDNVVRAMHINGVTDLIINKVDILQSVSAYSVIHYGEVRRFSNYYDFSRYVTGTLQEESNRELMITWSRTPDGI